MFPEEIINIILRYQSDNVNHIEKINQSIRTIKDELYSINDSIAKLMNQYMLDANVDNDAEKLLQDSISLRTYIKNIQTIDIPECGNDSPDKENTEIPRFNKYVYVYLISDDLCPFCNVKLIPHMIHFNRKVDNSIVNEKVKWYKCPACNRLYAIDYEIENFNFNDTNIKLNREQYFEIPDISIYSVVVLCNTLKCSVNHKTKDCIARLPILKEDGSIYWEKIPASYCFDCKRFTILKSDFDKIEGIVLCKVEDNSSELVNGNSTEFEIEQKASILFQYGYNVQTKKNLSEKQRHTILASLIEAQIMNRRDIQTHLTTLIDRGSKIKSWEYATQKWKDDLDFIRNYKSDFLPEIIVDKIILKYNTTTSNNKYEQQKLSL